MLHDLIYLRLGYCKEVLRLIDTLVAYQEARNPLMRSVCKSEEISLSPSKPHPRKCSTWFGISPLESRFSKFSYIEHKKLWYRSFPSLPHKGIFLPPRILLHGL
jgi:hypothetical protein